MNGSRPWIVERAAVTPTRPAVAVGDRVLNFAELEVESSALAGALAAAGVGRGDVVAVLVETGLSFARLVHAVARRGAILLPLSTRLTPHELAFQLVDARAATLVHDRGELAERAAAATEGLAVRCTPVPDGAPPPAASASDARVRPGRTLAILYTSGTTGRPKGAALSHRNFHASAVASTLQLGVLPGDRWLACLPLYHVGGLSILLRSVVYGTPVVIHERFDPERVSDALDDGISFVSLVPTMLARLLDARNARPAPPSLRCLLLGGAAAPPALVERARKLGFPIAPTYGLTEATSRRYRIVPRTSNAASMLRRRPAALSPV